MRVFRLSKGDTEHYTSFEELRAAWGLKAFTKQTKDKNRLAKQRENFCARNICPICKQPMVYIGGNQLVCKNVSCNGYKHEVETDSGEKKVFYTPVFKLLDETSAEIANNLFSEYE